MQRKCKYVSGIPYYVINDWNIIKNKRKLRSIRRDYMVPYYPMFDVGFFIVLALVIAVIIIIFAIIIIQAARGGAQWSKNNHSPVLTVHAKVVTKRADVTHHHHVNAENNGMTHTTSSTIYFVTFQVDSGDRIELVVPDGEYGMLVEQDEGNLTFQGTRYRAFARV
jgi:hypothetical protein